MKKFLTLIALLASVAAFGQADKQDVRRGNRQFRKARYGDADISYRRALNADSTSFAAAYDLASNLYRQGDDDNAGKYLQQAQRHLDGVAPKYQEEYAFRACFNAGDVAIRKQDWRGAVDAFVQALVLRPDDLEAKENYIYARKMLENQPEGGDGQDNQDQNQNQDQDKDQQQNQDQQQDPDKDQNQDGQPQEQPYSGSDISPQQAQQMLQAIQAKEKETQDKVNKEKAAALKSRQKDKNW